MGQKGKVTKTEIFLLLLTVVFVLLMAVLYFSGASGSAAGSYVVTPQKGSGASEVTVQKVDLNTADLEMLQSLEGIGPVLAQRIIDWRENGGVFCKPEDLLQIEGIGEATLEAVRDFIITEEES